MPYSVGGSFDRFRCDAVDLVSSQVESARSSKGFLENQITAFPAKYSDFPLLYGKYEQFGSFARKTKVRPLDDIDLLILLDETGVQPSLLDPSRWPYTYRLTVTNGGARLARYLNEAGSISSIKVLNRLKTALESVAQYEKADLHRHKEAITLKLRSYDWVFDLVPAIPYRDGSGSILYYFIPGGDGYWKRTDPRRDQSNITAANKQHNSKLIPLIRLLKYWNAYRTGKPKLGSYYFETMLINGFRNKPSVSTLQDGVAVAFQELAMQLTWPCPDPKQLGPNLDEAENVSERQKVKDAAWQMHSLATAALGLERQGNHQQAIEKWARVFPNFPPYGG